jgi:uncharacterized protein involved in exopolysaccharide biosynthesis
MESYDLQARHELSVATIIRGFFVRWKLFAAALGTLWVLGLLYILLTPSQYEASADFTYVSQSYETPAPSGIAALASTVGLGGPTSAERSVAIATLRSRQLAQDFVTKYHLLPLLFPKAWDSERNAWKDEPKKPSPRDGADRLRLMINISDNSDTNVISLTMRMRDQQRVALLVNAYVQMADDVLRHRSLNDNQESLAYLEDELTKTNVAELRLSITNLIEQSLQHITVTKTRSDYAFNVVDAAVVPKERVWPRAGLLMAVMTILGIFAAMFISGTLDLRENGHI